MHSHNRRMPPGAHRSGPAKRRLSRPAPPRDRDELKMGIEPPHRRGQRERGRMVAQGRNTEDNRISTLLVVAENDESWTFHGLGVPGVKISKSDAVDLAQGILAVTQPPGSAPDQR